MNNTIGAMPPAASAAPLNGRVRTPATEAADCSSPLLPLASLALGASQIGKSAGDVICAISPAGLAALSDSAQQGAEQVLQLAQNAGEQLLQGLSTAGAAVSDGAQSLVDGAAPYAALGALVLGQLMNEQA